MVTVFDAADARFDPYLLIVPVIVLIVAGVIFARARSPGWRYFGGGIVALVGLLFMALPIADLYHVRAALTDGSAKSLEGVISQHKRETVRRWAGRSTGVGISNANRYTTSTTEQFYAGPQWFWLRVNGFPSGASFTNGADPPLDLVDGTRVRITWFNDPWFNDETRILKFEMEKTLPSGTAAQRFTPAASDTDSLPSDFKSFWARFSQAAGKGDREGVKALTRFPFSFEGTPLNSDRFDNIWIGIFPAPLRPCFQTAQPLSDGENYSVSCGVYVYVFEKDAQGWHLASFTADPEAAE
jgi:hypothetical protein